MLSKRLNEAKDYILHNNHYGLSEKILMDAEFAEQAKNFFTKFHIKVLFWVDTITYILIL